MYALWKHFLRSQENELTSVMVMRPSNSCDKIPYHYFHSELIMAHFPPGMWSRRMLQHCIEIMSNPCRFPQQPSEHQERAREDRGVCQALLQSFRGTFIVQLFILKNYLQRTFVVKFNSFALPLSLDISWICCCALKPRKCSTTAGETTRCSPALQRSYQVITHSFSAFLISHSIHSCGLCKKWDLYDEKRDS